MCIKIFIYYFIYFLLLILSFYEISKKKVKLFYCEKFIYIFLTIITGLRYKNGTDFKNYEEIFRNIENIHYLENGFTYLIKLNNNIFDYNMNFLILSILNFVLLYYGLKKVKYRFFSLFIYVNIFWIPYSFNALRQSIAMNCFLIFIQEKKTFKKLLLFFLAVSFHKISLYIFILYFIFEKLNLKLKNTLVKKLPLMTVPLFFILILSSKKIVYFLSSFIPKLYEYSLIDYDKSILGIIFRLILIAFISLFWKVFKKDKLYVSLYIFYIFGFLIYGLFYEEYMFSTRINMFIRILELILIPTIIYHIKNISNKLCFFIILVFMIGNIYYKEINYEDNSPYKINHKILKIIF